MAGATPTSGELAKLSKPKRRTPTQKERHSALQRATERTKEALRGNPPPELYHHHTVEQRGSVDAPKGHSGYIVRDERWIDRYWHEGRLDERQYEAARKLYEIWFAAGLSPKLVGDYGESVDGGGSEGAEQRQQRALDELGYVKRSLHVADWWTLETVVIWDYPAGRTCSESERRRHGRVWKLAAALDELARIWKI